MIDKHIDGFTYWVVENEWSSPYCHVHGTLFIQEMVPDKLGHEDICLNCTPTGRGRLVVTLHHAEIALIDSGICHIALYRKGQSAPLWLETICPDNSTVLTTYGSSRGDIRLTLPDRGWEEGTYFILVSNLEENPILSNFVLSPYGYTLLSFTMEYPEIGGYAFTDEWANLDKKEVVCEDGMYVLPDMETNGSLVLKDVEINFINEFPVQLISQGLMPLEINFTVNAIRKTFSMPLAIYRVGQAQPLWTRFEWIDEDSDNCICLTSGVLDMTPGRYFLLVGGVQGDGNGDYPIQTLNGCVRYDFEVLPHGKTLSEHPAIECIEVHPHPLDDWKEFVSDRYIEGPSATIAITFSIPETAGRGLISIGCLDEHDHLIGSCRSITADGTCTLNTILPLLSGHYRLVVCHNEHPYLCGRFNVIDGKVSEVGISNWDAEGLPARLAAAATNHRFMNYPGREIYERLNRIVKGQEPMPNLLALMGGYFSHMRYICEVLYPGCEIIERSVSDLCTEDVWDILGTMSPSDNHIVLCLTEAGRLDLLTLELREQLLNVVSKPGRTVILYDKQDVSIMLGHCPEVDVCIPASCRWSIEEDASPVERRIDLWHRMTNDEPGSWDELDGML